jgi:hypothetical protein
MGDRSGQGMVNHHKFLPPGPIAKDQMAMLR